VTVQIQFVDRDVAVALMREAENESEIDRLTVQVAKAREELRISEQALAAVEESLSGNAQTR
jgi:hypothetical protein